MQTIITTIQQCAPRIAELLRHGDARKSGAHNASGDEQLALDVRADCLIADALKALPCVRMIASEERENPETANDGARYCVAYDPLDGSSVVASDFAVGSIFGIYDTDFRADKLVAAAYILYGFALEFVVATDSVVEHFRYQNDSFVSVGQLQLAKKGKINAPGGTQKDWGSAHAGFVAKLFAQGYRLRYSGAMVADLHQILIKGGGIFSYPKSDKAPHGKLRLLFELLPFAFIYEKAGGAATDGSARLLSLPVAHAHATSAAYLGSVEEIALARQILGGDNE